MAGYAYKNAQTTRVSRRSSLVNAAPPQLSLNIPNSSFSSASAASRSPMKTDSPVGNSGTLSNTLKYVPSSLTSVLTPKFSEFSDQAAETVSDFFETPFGRKLSIFAKQYFNYVRLFCVLWLILIWYGERTYPYNALKSCHWNTWETWEGNTGPTRVAVLTDPQLVDAHTYPGRPRVLQKVTEYISDLYLRRNWVNMNILLDSDANVFMGDLFDGGRNWTNTDWQQEFVRFSGIFNKPAYKKTIMSLPGNHDIGFGNTLIYPALQRFRMFFGDPSSSHVIGNHTFVFLDTISLMNTNNKTINSEPEEFLQNLVTTPEFDAYPRILLTHVPLYRSIEVSCGPHRERKREPQISYSQGEQYQTLVTPEISDWVLQYVRPSVVFSGDDHDACYVQHNYTIERQDNTREQKKADEYTVKSPSMAMGVSKPAVQLLSLVNPPSHQAGHTTPSYGNGNTYQTSLCFMPHPFYAIILYAISALFTLTVILIVNFLPAVFPPVVRQVLNKHKRSRSYFQPVSTLYSPAVAFGHPLMPTYEDMLDGKSSSATDTDKRPNMDTTLLRARRMVKDPKIWMGIATDVAVVSGCTLCFFLFLGWSIYRN